MSKLDDRGREIVDSRPMSVPAGLRRPETLAEQIRRMVKMELSQAADSQGFETFEEADDFEVDDDYDPRSPWEMDFDPAGNGEGGKPDGAAASGTDRPGPDGAAGPAAGTAATAAAPTPPGQQNPGGQGNEGASVKTPS